MTPLLCIILLPLVPTAAGPAVKPCATLLQDTATSASERLNVEADTLIFLFVYVLKNREVDALVASRIDRFPVANMKSGWISAQTYLCHFFYSGFQKSTRDEYPLETDILACEMFLWWLTDGSVASAFVGPLLLPSLLFASCSSLHFAAGGGR